MLTRRSEGAVGHYKGLGWQLPNTGPLGLAAMGSCHPWPCAEH